MRTRSSIKAWKGVPEPRTYRLGVDVGGTFTDFTLFEESTSTIDVFKIPSTPDDQSRAVISGALALLARQGASLADVAYFAHGTTVATNASLEGRTANVGLITTRGFRDLLEIRRQKRDELYDLFYVKPPPPISRDLRLEVQERIDSHGAVITPLDEAEVKAAAVALKDAGVAAIAIVFLHAFVNSAHERRAKALVKSASGLPVWASHEVLPEFREFERLSTTIANAGLGPVMRRYLSRLRSGLSRADLGVSPHVMQSSGGVMTIGAAQKRPVKTLMSGPSAGVMGAIYVAGLAGVEDFITFDMGGTSTDVCLIQAGAPQITTQRDVAGYPIRAEMIDVHSIGAGGGSVAWVDGGGRLKVGPRSMGARPGPAAYGHGGDQATVTDANVVLGRMGGDDVLGGTIRLHVDLARRTIEHNVARPLGLGLIDAARAIVRIANSNMVLAARKVSIERGLDPRDFELVAFGGAGPLHAAEVGLELGAKRILIPDVPGILCSLGLLTSDVRNDYVRTVMLRDGEESPRTVDRMWTSLERAADTWLRQEGVAKADRRVERSADVRYVGQNYEIRIPVAPGRWQAASFDALISDFQVAHLRAYGYAAPEESCQVVSLRVTALGVMPKITLHPRTGTPAPTRDPARERLVYWDAGAVTTAVIGRESLKVRSSFDGPAVLEQMDSTVLVPPGHRATVDDFGNLLIDLPPGERLPGAAGFTDEGRVVREAV